MFNDVGAAAFGLVIGWIAYRTLRRSDGTGIGDLTTVVAALGGGAVVDTRFADPELFSAYGLGLAAGFFAYFLTGAWLDRRARERAAAAATAAAAAGGPGNSGGPSSGAPGGTPGGTPAGTPAGAAAPQEAIGAHTWQGEGPDFQRSSRRSRKEFEQ